MESFTQVVLAGDKAVRRRKRDGTQRIHLYVRIREVPIETTPVMPPSSMEPRSAAELRELFFKPAAFVVVRSSQLRRRLFMPRRPARQNYWRLPRKRCNDQEDKRVDSLLTEQLNRLESDAMSSIIDTNDPTLLFKLPSAITPAPIRSSLTQSDPILMNSSDVSDALAEHVFTFDLRSQSSVHAFHEWVGLVGDNAGSVSGLSLKHWTSYWAYGANNWVHRADETRISRGHGGQLVVERNGATPLDETCTCSVSSLLNKFDYTFDPEDYRGISHVRQFAAYLSLLAEGSCDDSEEQAHTHKHMKRRSILDAGVLFASMLEAHSAKLAREYVRAGSECSKCTLPTLYLCGSQTSRKTDGQPVEFAMMATRKGSR
ncbi:hypothetical protein B0A48_02681 [Cryoendolithus antarcticus]|uniref:Uncharacterized protein n=1 Tax=Cryoendolithus antarcticus TaxID=1507870 RepID=A0A1V8TLE0_9PEZI|nr:hypothetical protein B0A48_02681 [Cryoendolithus antarcticus]